MSSVSAHPSAARVGYSGPLGVRSSAAGVPRRASHAGRLVAAPEGPAAVTAGCRSVRKPRPGRRRPPPSADWWQAAARGQLVAARGGDLLLQLLTSCGRRGRAGVDNGSHGRRRHASPRAPSWRAGELHVRVVRACAELARGRQAPPRRKNPGDKQVSLSRYEACRGHNEKSTPPPPAEARLMLPK